MSTTDKATNMGLRICVVTNYYPPHFIGGYELGCRDIVEALKRRGHQVRVLTSTYKVDQPQTRWRSVSLVADQRMVDAKPPARSRRRAQERGNQPAGFPAALS